MQTIKGYMRGEECRFLQAHLGLGITEMDLNDAIDKIRSYAVHCNNKDIRGELQDLHRLADRAYWLQSAHRLGGITCQS